MIWLVAGSSYAVLVLFVLVLGVGYGGFVALSPIVIADRLGVAGLGSILGLLYTGPGLGGLIGPPSAGWLIDHTDGYRWAIIGLSDGERCGGSAADRSPPSSPDGRLERAADAKGWKRRVLAADCLDGLVFVVAEEDQVSVAMAPGKSVEQRPHRTIVGPVPDAEQHHG